jgi:hypothetical protein
MPAHRECMVMVLSGTYMVLQEGRKSCLPNLGVVAPYYLGKPEKGPRDGLYVPTLWGGRGRLRAHRLRTCPELESPRKRNFVQVPPPLSVMTMDQTGAAWFFQEVFNWDLP